MTESKQITYRDAGVDTAEGARAVDAIKASVKSTNRAEVIGGIGGFGGLFSAAALKDMEDPILISGTDGVGTKLVLAKMFDKHNTVGIDLVAMCVNDILVTGAEPLFFLDYIAIGKIDSAHVAQIVEGIAEGCRQSGCALVGGEMAEHPGVMDPKDYDLAGFTVGVVDRPKMIDTSKVAPGDVIIGLPSSGIHSNGFSLVRAALIDGHDASEFQEPLERLDNKTVAQALLEPTRIYVKSVREALATGAPVKALAHITGGGITENLNRALPENVDAVVAWDTWERPGIIDMVCEAAGLTREESYKTFNMGLGMAVICAPEDEAEVTAAFVAAGEKPFKVGRIAQGTGQVVYE